VNPTKEKKFQNKVYNLSDTLGPAFVSTHVHSTIQSSVYKTTWKARV